MRLHERRWQTVGYATGGAANALLSADLGPNLPGGPRLFASGPGFFARNSAGTAINGLAMWNGTAWQSVGGLSYVANALAVFDDGQGAGPQLYIAGNYFLNGTAALVLRWNGSTWQALPQPAPGGSNSLGSDFAIFDDGSGPALYLAGTFSPSQTAAGGLAKWTGQAWSLIPGPQIGASLTSVVGFNGQLCVGGTFSLSTGIEKGVAIRNPDGSWRGLGVRTLNYGYPVTLSTVQEPSGQALYIGGLFLPTDSGPSYSDGGFIRYDGASLSTPIRTYSGFSSQGSITSPGVTTQAVLFDAGRGPEVFVGGRISAFSVASTTQPVLSVPTQGYVRIPQAGPNAGRVLEGGEGLGFSPAYFSGPPRLGMRKVFFAGREQLAFTGNVFSGGGIPSGSYALFDGQTWTVNPQYQYSSFLDILPVNDAGNERLLVATFSEHLGFVVPGSPHVAPYSTNAPGFTGAVTMLFFDDGNTNGPVLYILDQSRLIRRVNGQWQTLLSTGQPGALLVADLGAGPQLFLAGLVNGIPGVGVWNGSSFELLDSQTFPSAPTSLALHDDGSGPAIYAGFNGILRLSSGAATGRVAKFDGTHWSALGHGLTNGSVRLAMQSFDDGSGPALYVAGDFLTAGDRPSRGFARWHANQWEPVLDINPQSTALELSLATLGDSLYLAGYLADSGLRLPGASMDTASNIITAGNLLAIRRCPPACFPDLNRDGAVDQGDVDYLINAVSGGDNPTGANLDLNSDDVVDQADVDVLVNVVAGAPCGN
ncbi:MAG: hypothetical protein GC200_11475 [Tepidisphaera sp.]|nr:hypothetical protein [Tepidisphaera sp.]